MRWFKPNIRSSLYGLLGPGGRCDSHLEAAEDTIRDAMLDLLEAHGVKDYSHVVRRIRYADDLQALWYLRGDLMAALAASRGEAAARELLAPVTGQFQGLLPGGLSSRPSPLA